LRLNKIVVIVEVEVWYDGHGVQRNATFDQRRNCTTRALIHANQVCQPREFDRKCHEFVEKVRFLPFGAGGGCTFACFR
jgi:hypothetical protein